MIARLLSVNVGLPREILWRGQTVRTSVWKNPVEGKRMVRRLNIEGDAQSDLASHGGEHLAVFVYQIDSYKHWQDELRRTDFTFGQFGENFTVEGLPDTEVCVGDQVFDRREFFDGRQNRTGARIDDHIFCPKSLPVALQDEAAAVAPSQPGMSTKNRHAVCFQ